MSRLLCLRTGDFSGSALSLLRALRGEAVEVEDLDLYTLSRHPRLLAARAAGLVEARGSSAAWPKTAAWSRSNQRLVERTHNFCGTPTVVVQTVAAFVFPPGARYVVYTDRVGQEGCQQVNGYGSVFSSGWARREAAMLRGAQRVLVMGPSTQSSLVDAYGLPPDRVAVVGAAPNGRLTPGRLRSSPTRLLFVGTQWALKGGPELLAAFGVLRRSRPELSLTLVGSRPEGPLPEGVRALGRIPHDEMDRVYEQADVLVMPTKFEAFGIAYVEALRKGLPCVGGDVGNVQWIIGDAGLVVPPSDASALVTALTQVLDDYPRFASRALQRGVEQADRWSWQAVARLAHDALQVGAPSAAS